MQIEQLRGAIAERAMGRFEVEAGSDYPGPEESASIVGAAIVRLRRLRTEAGWRTLLLVRLADDARDPTAALRWAAEVRDLLTDPEPADLYLLLVAPGLTEARRRRLDADEQFCRKYVIGTGHRVEDLLDRTFLAIHDDVELEMSPDDPLALALARVAAVHPWISESVRTAWRNALLSGRTGADLAEALHDAAPRGAP